MLTAEQKAAFDRDGFLLIEDFVDTEECELLIDRATELVDAWDPSEARSVFSSKNQTQSTDDYFLESGDKIRFFFEEEAFDQAGALRQSKARSINKVGHALHDLDPVFDAFSRQPALAALVAQLGMEQPLLLQSMYIFKQPRIGGEVVCHQDAAFLHTEPVSVLGLWFALEDATTLNGCMYALRGGHRGPLRTRFLREGDATRTVTLDPTPLPADGLMPLQAPQGTLIVLDGLLPHLSGPNRSERSRHAYALHVIDGRARYSAGNWLQRGPGMPLRGF